MEFAVLLFSAILIVKFFIKRSPAITVAHIIFFVIIAYLSMFTTDVPFIADFTKNLFGAEEYAYFRRIMCEPCVCIYSTNFAIFVVELLLLFIVHIFTLVYITHTLLKSRDKEYERNIQPQFDWECIPARSVRFNQKIYLNNCSLLI